MGKSQRERYAEQARRNAERRRAGLPEDEVARLVNDFGSEDEAIRFRALRDVCPCHVGLEVFAEVRKAAQRLRRDSSERVREAAWHLERDAVMIAGFEAAAERRAEADPGPSPSRAVDWKRERDRQRRARRRVGE